MTQTLTTKNTRKLPFDSFRFHYVTACLKIHDQYTLITYNLSALNYAVKFYNK